VLSWCCTELDGEYMQSAADLYEKKNCDSIIYKDKEATSRKKKNDGTFEKGTWKLNRGNKKDDS